MDYAVKVQGKDEAQAFWVLAVDVAQERFLVVVAEGVFEWVAIADCTLGRLQGPEQPILVVPVQPEPQSRVVVPGQLPNRAMRRNGDMSL